MTNQLLSVKLIKQDSALQPRAKMDTGVIDDYTNSMKAGASFPPVVVYKVGEDYLLADGYHRFMAVQGAGFTKILADVRIGTTRDAILCSVGVNATHGLQRTNEDKRRAVLILLRDKGWSVWSNGQIAKACNVSDDLVRTVKAEIQTEKNDLPSVSSVNGKIPSKKTKVERAGKVFKMDTSRIGKKTEPVTAPAITDADKERKETFGIQEQTPAKDREDLPINCMTVPEKNPLDPVPPPCSCGIPCPTKEFQQKDEKGRTGVCMAAGAEVRQLDECPHDMKKRKTAMAAASGFTPASRVATDGLGNRIIRGPPLKITKTPKTPAELEKIVDDFLTYILDEPEQEFVRKLADKDFDGDLAQTEREIHILANQGGE